jgi:hypothetical protein
MGLLNEVGGFLSREVKFEEAAYLNNASAALNRIAPKIEPEIDASAPQTVATVIAAVEKVDGSVLGPAGAAFVNGALSAFAADINAEVAKLAPVVGTFVVKLASAAATVAAREQAFALAEK